MQKINIKKVTKEQMLKMLEEAAEKQEAAEAEAAAHSHRRPVTMQRSAPITQNPTRGAICWRG